MKSLILVLEVSFFFFCAILKKLKLANDFLFIKAVYETLMPQTELLYKHITVFLSLETINYRHQ